MKNCLGAIEVVFLVERNMFAQERGNPAFWSQIARKSPAGISRAFSIHTNKGDGRNFSRSNKGVYVCL